MTEALLKLAPVVLTFVLGILLRATGVLKKTDGEVLLKIVFYASLPALVLLTVSKVELTREVALLPIIAVIIIFVSFLASFVLRPLTGGERPVIGVAIVGSMIMNVSFLYPFIIAVYGQEGFAKTILFDFGNSLLVFTLIYYIACRYGAGSRGATGALKKLVTAPPLWALAGALVLNLGDVEIGSVPEQFLSLIGNLTTPLIMLALGIYFTPRLVRAPLLFSVLFIRVGLGLACGLLLARIFGLEGLTRSIVVVCSAAPVGFNTLTFATITELDVDFATSLLSTSIILGIAYVPVLMLVLQ